MIWNCKGFLSLTQVAMYHCVMITNVCSARQGSLRGERIMQKPIYEYPDDGRALS